MKRVLLKLSGEALAGDKKTGFDEATCIGVANQVKKLVDDGIQVAIVTGGGNFWRGRTSETIDRTKADQIGDARNGDELYLRIRYFQTCRYEDSGVYTVCVRLFYIPVLKRCGSGGSE